MATVRRCSIQGCHTELSPRSKLDECPACRAYILSYLKARPARVMARRQAIHLYDSRLQVIMPGNAEALTESTRLIPPANYKPQSRKGRQAVKQAPRRVRSNSETRANA